MKAVDLFYEKQPIAIQSVMMAMRDCLLSMDADITNELKYGMPFFLYRQKMFCYLWFHKQYQQPYIGFVEGHRMQHPLLIQEKRARMKILLIDIEQDLPIPTIQSLVKEALDFYKSGLIAIPKNKYGK